MKKYLLIAAVAVSAVIFAGAAHVSLRGGLVTLATLVAMAVPGIYLMRRALGESASALAVLVFGTVLGLTVCRFGLAITGLLLGPGPLAVCLALGVLTALGVIGLWRAGAGAARPAWDVGDVYEVPWIAAYVSILFLALAVVFSGVGRPTPKGHAFVPYFDRDYMNHVSVTAEIARELPPQNPSFAGERLHYYWFSHLWPAAVKNVTGISAREALNGTIVPSVALFVAALALWARLYVPARGARYFGVGVGLFAFSYIGLLFAAKTWLPVVGRRLPNISFLSHSWFRDFLYEPHALSALTLLLTILFLSHSAALRRRPFTGLLVGLLFGAMLVTDAFVALLAIFYFAVTHVGEFVRSRESRGSLLITAGVTAAVAAAAVAVGIFPRGGGNRALDVALHPLAKIAPIYLTLDLGPLLVLGAVGCAIAVFRKQLGEFRPLIVLLGIALVVAFILRAPVEANIALRKGIKVAQLPLAVFVGVAATAALAARRPARWGLLVALVALPGLATLGTDVFQYLDRVPNRATPTIYVSGDEMDMLEWVRTHAPADAVLQAANPDLIFGQATPLFIQALGEHRTFYGNDEMPPMFQIPAGKVRERKDGLESFFAATQPAQAAGLLNQMPHLYLYVDEDARGPVAVIRQLEAEGAIRHVHRAGHFSLKEVVSIPIATRPSESVPKR